MLQDRKRVNNGYTRGTQVEGGGCDCVERVGGVVWEEMDESEEEWNKVVEVMEQMKSGKAQPPPHESKATRVRVTRNRK